MRSNKDTLQELIKIRLDIEAFVDRVIHALNELDAETEDLEYCNDDDGVDGEPSLGATEDFDQQDAWRPTNQHTPDLEED